MKKNTIIERINISIRDLFGKDRNASLERLNRSFRDFFDHYHIVPPRLIYVPIDTTQKTQSLKEININFQNYFSGADLYRN